MAHSPTKGGKTMNEVLNFDLKTDHIDAEAVKLVEENFIHTRKVFPYKINDK